MTTDISKRIFYTIACFFAALLFPYWFVYLVVAVGMYWFDWYVEGLAIVVIQEILFAVPLERLHHFLWIGTAGMFIIFALMEMIKKVTRYGHS